MAWIFSSAKCCLQSGRRSRPKKQVSLGKEQYHLKGKKGRTRHQSHPTLESDLCWVLKEDWEVEPPRSLWREMSLKSNSCPDDSPYCNVNWSLEWWKEWDDLPYLLEGKAKGAEGLTAWGRTKVWYSTQSWTHSRKMSTKASTSTAIVEEHDHVQGRETKETARVPTKPSSCTYCERKIWQAFKENW